MQKVLTDRTGSFHLQTVRSGQSIHTYHLYDLVELCLILKQGHHFLAAAHPVFCNILCKPSGDVVQIQRVTGQPVDCREVTFVSQCGIQSPEYLNDTQGCLRYRLRNISTWRGYCSDYGQCAFSSVFSKVYHMSGSLIELCQTGS